MKKNYLGLIIALGITVSACQKDGVSTVIPDTTKQAAINWNNATPHVVFNSPNTGFEISEEILNNALAIDEVSSVRFVLETLDDQLQIRVVGVSASGLKTTGKVVAQNDLRQTLNQLHLTETKVSNIDILANNIAKHVLQPAQATAYIQGWQRAFKNNALEEIVSYDGERIRHFSMPALVVQQMADAGGVQLVWGLNTEEKLSTVFLPKTNRNNEQQGYIYDFSEPCPLACNPETH